MPQITTPQIIKTSLTENAKVPKKTHSWKPDKVKPQSQRIQYADPMEFTFSSKASLLDSEYGIFDVQDFVDLGYFELDLPHLVNAIIEPLHAQYRSKKNFNVSPYDLNEHKTLLSMILLTFAIQILNTLSQEEQKEYHFLNAFSQRQYAMPESVTAIINNFGNIYTDLGIIKLQDAKHIIDNLVVSAIELSNLPNEKVRDYKFAERLFVKTDVGLQKLVSDTCTILSDCTSNGLRTENFSFHPPKLQHVTSKEEFLHFLTKESAIYPKLDILYDLSQGKSPKQKEFDKVSNFYGYELDFLNEPRANDNAKIERIYSEFKLLKNRLPFHYVTKPLSLSPTGGLGQLFIKDPVNNSARYNVEASDTDKIFGYAFTPSKRVNVNQSYCVRAVSVPQSVVADIINPSFI